MVTFQSENKEIELLSYSPETTLKELSEALEEFRLSCRLKTLECKGCGECCSDNIPVLGLDLEMLRKGLGMEFRQLASEVLIMPERPDTAFRRKAIGAMSEQGSLTELEATLMYEYNNAEPIILGKQPDGECCFLLENLCSRYAIRPYSCGLYLCNMGERLSYLQEMIIRQGTWHAYNRLGWIEADEIAHNPFLKADSYDKLLIRDFDFKLDNALAQLFFYF